MTSTSNTNLYSITVPSSVNPSYSPTTPLSVVLSNNTSSSITVTSTKSSRIQNQLYLNFTECGAYCINVLSPSNDNISYAFGSMSVSDTSSTTQFPLTFRSISSPFSLQTQNGLEISLLNLPFINFTLQFFDSSFKALNVNQALTVTNGSVTSAPSNSYFQIQQQNFTLTNGYGVVEGATNSLYTVKFTTYINSYTNTASNCLIDSNGYYYLSTQSGISKTSSPLAIQFDTTISFIELGVMGVPIEETNTSFPLTPFTYSYPMECLVTKNVNQNGTLLWFGASQLVTPPMFDSIPPCIFNNLPPLPPFIPFEFNFSFFELEGFSFTTSDGEGPSPENNYNLYTDITITNIYGAYTGDSLATFLMVLVSEDDTVYYFPVSTNFT
jgi:hypothetical protein